MTNFNRLIIAGNLTKDPDLRYTTTGKPVASFSVAINHTFKDGKGEKREDVTFVPVTVWGKQAETTAEFMKKGRPVFIEGRLRQERWVDKDGQKRQRLTMTGNTVRFLGKPAKDQDPKQPIEEEDNQPPLPEEQIPSDMEQ